MKYKNLCKKYCSRYSKCPEHSRGILCKEFKIKEELKRYGKK